jgi:hypothetical protein
MRARRTTATTTALLATLALAGCEKPTPFVTVYSSGTAADTKASVWCFEGQETEEECRQADIEPPQVPVKSGSLSINVDSEIAERGWWFQQEGQPAEAPRVQFGEYLVVPGVQLPPDGIALEIVAGDGSEAGGRQTGLYRFQLVPGE